MDNYEYSLDVELFERFDLKVYDIYPLNRVFILYTDKGQKILKKSKCNIYEFNFIEAALSYVKERFDNVMVMCKTKAGKTYTSFRGDIYTVIDVIEGQTCEFSNPLHLRFAARDLAKMHKAGSGFESRVTDRIMTKALETKLRREVSELKIIKNLISRYDSYTNFDKRIKSCIQYYINMGDKSIKELIVSPYPELIQEMDKVTICHNDLANHNMIISNNQAHFIDFDYAVIALKVCDLNNLINKVEKEFDFDIDKAKVIIESYNEENHLDIRELKVLKILLSFPQDFYSICRDYYINRKTWDEEVFLSRLEKKLQMKESREEFLESFEKEFINYGM